MILHAFMIFLHLLWNFAQRLCKPILSQDYHYIGFKQIERQKELFIKLFAYVRNSKSHKHIETYSFSHKAPILKAYKFFFL